MQLPTYFVYTSEGNLEAYHREDLLRCDLASNKENPPRGIFRLSNEGLTFNYVSVDVTEILNRHSPMKLPTGTCS